MKTLTNHSVFFIGFITALSTYNVQAANIENNENPYVCTDDEVNAIMTTYQETLGTVDSHRGATYSDFRDIRMVHLSQDPDSKDDNLCSIIMNPNFDLPSFNLADLKTAWASLKALMTVKSGGFDWNLVMTTAYDKLMAKAKAMIYKKTCKLAADFSDKVNDSINEVWDESKGWAEEKVNNNEELNDLGITDINSKSPIYQQIAKKQTENQLKEYANYAKWYESDRWGAEDGTMQESVDDIIDKILNDGTDAILDKNIKDDGSDRLDDFLDNFKPKY